MAESDIVQHSSLVADDAIPFVQEQIEELIGVIEGQLNPALIQSAQNLNVFAKSFKIDTASLSQIQLVNTKLSESNQLALVAAQAKKLEADARRAAAAAAKDELTVQEKLNKEKKKEEEGTRKSASAYSQLTAELNKNRQAAKDLQASVAQGNKLTEDQASALAKATAETQRLDAQVKQIDYSVGQAQRNVGNYNNQLGTLAKSVKGFGALGRILGRAIGIDTEVFQGIREAGIALRDLHHIQEGGKLIKEGETAATEAHTVALGAETTAQEAEAAASVAASGGTLLIVSALIAAGTAIVAYIFHIKEQIEQEKQLLKIREEQLKYFVEIKKDEAKNARERYEIDQEQLVIEKKITDAEKERRLAVYDSKKESIDAHFKEIDALRDLAKVYGFDVDAQGNAIKKKIELKKIYAKESGRILGEVPDTENINEQEERLKKFEQAKLDINKNAASAQANIQTDLQNKLNKIGQDEEKKEDKKDDSAIKKHEELLKRLAELTLKYQAEDRKELSKTNEEKIQAEYDNAQIELTAMEGTEKEKAASRLALEKLYRDKFIDARIKDEQEAQKKIDEAEKAQLEEFKKQQSKKADEAKKAHELQLSNLKLAEEKELSAVGLSEKQKFDIKFRYNELRKKLDEDNQIYQNEINIKEIEDENALREKQIKERQKVEDEIFKGVEEGLKKKEDLEQQSDQTIIDFHKRTIDIQKTLAAAGKANTLGEEEAAATKAEEKKIQDAKKAARLQEDIALVKTFSDTLQKALDSGKPFGQALGEAAAAEGIVAAVFSKLFAGNFAEGVENFQGKGTGKSDSNIIGFSRGESVATAEGTAQTPGLVTAINKGGFKGVQDWAFEHIYKPQFNAANVSTTQEKAINTVAYDPELLAEIKLLRTEIASKPVQMIQVKGLTEVLETVQRGNITTRTTYVANRRNIRQNG